MSMAEKNASVFEVLKQKYPELEAFTVDKGFLIFRDKKIDISKFDLELLINVDFINTIKGRNPEDIFKIFEDRITVKKEVSNEVKLSTIILENPSMKNITIFTNENLNTHIKEEFINIRTTDGKNCLFKNTNGFDLFDFYYSLERIYGDAITPDIVADEINKWSLNKLEVVNSEEVLNKEECKESLKNKIREIKAQYSDRSEITIEANIEEEIVYINNTKDPEKNMIVTFEFDINNELVMVVHKANVKQETIKVLNGDIPENIGEMETNLDKTTVTNSVGDSSIGGSNMSYINSDAIISKQELLKIVSGDGPYAEEEKTKIDKFFEDVKRMIENNNAGYEDIINELNKYIEELQISKDEFTMREQDFMNRCYQLNDELEIKKGNGKGVQIVLKSDNKVSKQYGDNDNYGFSSPASIIILISSIVVVLSIIVLSLF